MIEKLKQLRVLALAGGYTVVVLAAFLCGCDSQANLKADKEAGDYYKVANTYHQRGQYDMAVVACKIAIAIKPDYVEARQRMVEAYYAIGQDWDRHREMWKTLDKWPRRKRVIFDVNGAVKM